MEKTKEQLLADFKKANKQRRQKIAEKAGFKTTEEYLVNLAKKPLKTAPRKTQKPSKKELLDYVVAFDTTGSMASYIDNVKLHVEKLIPELFSNDVDLKMQIIAFGDYCDAEWAGSTYSTKKYIKDFGKAFQKSEFTNNENDLIKFVKNAQNTSGGDGDEFYELVIKKIVEETPWREGSKKTVLFIADETPHKVGYKYNDVTFQIDWEEEARKAGEKGITFDTLSIHGDSRKWYKELATITNGVYLPFKSSNKMAEVVTATMYARSGDKLSKAKFKMSFATASSAGDTELIGTYKSLSTLLD